MHPTAVVSVVLKHMSLFLFHLGGILQLIFGKSVTASFLLFDLYSLLFWFIAFFFFSHTYLPCGVLFGACIPIIRLLQLFSFLLLCLSIFPRYLFFRVMCNYVLYCLMLVNARCFIYVQIQRAGN